MDHHWRPATGYQQYQFNGLHRDYTAAVVEIRTLPGAVWHTEDRTMSLHPTTFEYLKPTEEQIKTMERARLAARSYAEALDRLLPVGPDKTYALRKLREIAMWANVAITREASGEPRDYKARELYPV